MSEKYNVLLIERGTSPYGNLNITDITYFGVVLADTSPESPSQPFTSEDGTFLVRSRSLGGASAINVGFYSRASVDYVNSVGWDEKLVNESYQWAEKYVAFEPSVVEWQAGVRDGLLEAGVIPDNGFTYDHIPSTKTDGSIFDQTGYRHTAADLLQYANPQKLTVLLRGTVERILFTQKNKNILCIVLGCWKSGAVGIPQLLMLSGVGPAEHVKSHDLL